MSGPKKVDFEMESSNILQALVAAGVDLTKKEFPDRHLGVAVLVFDFGDGGFMNYAANANRSDMVKALRELANALDAGEAHYIKRKRRGRRPKR